MVDHTAFLADAAVRLLVPCPHVPDSGVHRDEA